MKKIFSAGILAMILLLGSCIKNKPVTVTTRFAELDAATWNSNTVNLTYPVIGRNPAYGRASTTDDSTLRRYAQTIQIRVNLNGPQSSKDETVGYTVHTSPITTFAMPITASCNPLNFPGTCSAVWTQSPAAAAATLAITDAVAGTHYVALTGTVTIPANSSFGFITLKILDAPSTAGAGKFIGLTLNNSGTIPALINYSQLGLVIDQR